MKKYLFLVLLLSGCHTIQQNAVVPAPVIAKVASWDGNVQNSGVISVSSKGFLCTPHFLARYDAMLGTSGDRLTPTRKPGDREGITAEGTNYRFDAEAFSRFIDLNTMRKSEEAP